MPAHNTSPSLRTLAFAVALLAASLTAAAPPPGDPPHANVPVPAAPGSVSPRLAAGADGTVVLSWLEPAGEAWALRFSRWDRDRWQAPRTVEMGDNWFVNWADLPSVTPVRPDFWVAQWLVRRPAGGYAYDVHLAVSTDGGDSFSPPLPAHGDDTDTEHGFVSTFPVAAGAGLAWLDGRQTATGGGMTLRTATLTPRSRLTEERQLDDLICDCCQTGATVSAEGPVVVYRDRSAGEVRDIYAVRSVDGNWLPGAPVAHDKWVIDGCPVNGPAVESAGREVVVAWFTAADGRPRVRLARSADSGSPFSAPVDVLDGDTVGRVGLALLDDGAAVVSALRPAAEGGAMLTLTRVTRDGAVGPAYELARGLSAFSVPQLTRAGDSLLVSWPVHSDGDRGIASALLPAGALD